MVYMYICNKSNFCIYKKPKEKKSKKEKKRKKRKKMKGRKKESVRHRKRLLLGGVALTSFNLDMVKST